MLTCATCGNEEPDGSQFCGNCGARFVPAEEQSAQTAMSSATMLICATCGHEEPEGSRFCGNCSAPFVTVEESAGQQPVELEPADTVSVDAALAPETLSPEPAAEQPLQAEEPRPAPSRTGNRRLGWIAAGAVGLLLAAGTAVAAVLTFPGGGDATEVITTEPQPLLGTTSETVPPVSNPALADTIGPYLEELAASQSALSAQVRSLQAGTESLAELRSAADAVAASVVRTRVFLDSLGPNDSTDAGTLLLLRRALASHLGYAKTIAGFPSRPRFFTEAHARAAIAQAEYVRRAYSSLAVADPTLPIVYISRSDDASFLAVVPSPKPAPAAAGRVVDLVPFLLGIGPNDPLGQGRCFGPYSSRASLRVSGVVYRRGFIQCGDDDSGDPSRASGVYAFSGPTYPGQSTLVRLTGQVAIDESSTASQRGSHVTWTVFYGGTPICSKTVVWSGSRPRPKGLDCKIPAAASSGGLDVGQLRIQQVASLASSGSFWAGLLKPRIVVEPL